LLPPNAPGLYKADGSLNWENSTWENPYRKLVSSKMQASANNIVANVDLSYQLVDGLLLKCNIGYTELRMNTFSGSTLAGIDPAKRKDATASANYLYSRVKSWVSEPQLHYTKRIFDGNLNLLVGATLQGNTNAGQNVSVFGIQDDALIEFPAAGTSYSVFGTGSKYKYAALFSRIGYNYLQRYLLNVTVRRDGSSRFGTNSRYANFGAVGLGWIFSEETLLKENLSSVLSFGKMRGSFGITGSDAIGDYQYLDRYEFVPQTYQDQKGVRVVDLFNPNFAWERTKKSELGLELGFFNDRIFLSGSYYSTFSNNQLLRYLVPSMAGAGALLGNRPAAIRNRGIELMLNTENIKRKDFSWTSSFVFSRNFNKIVALDGVDEGLGLEIGKPVTTRYLVGVNGVDRETGEYLFFDKDRKPVKEFYLADPKYKEVDALPKFSGGLQNSFRAGNVQLDVLMQVVIQDGVNGQFSSYIPGQMKNTSTKALERWRNPGDIAVYQRASQNYNLYGSYLAWLGSQQAYGDASFIRCKNVAFSWNMKKSWCTKAHLTAARFFLQCQNLFTITKYQGLDPETQSIESTPPLRTINIGINLSM
jgi:hypothetical protein